MKTKKNGSGVIFLRREVKTLQVPLTQEELLERGQQLAQVDSSLSEHNLHAESVKKELRAKESELQANQARLAMYVRNKSEPREIECTIEIRGNVYCEVRNDTGKVIYERPAQPSEMQANLFDKKSEVVHSDLKD